MGQESRHPLVVGSGIAGLFVALRSREAGLRPVLITKSRLEESNTRYAQGGLAAAVGDDDSVDLHRTDTLAAGDGLVNSSAARVLATETPRRVADLVRYGVPFDTVEGRIALGREGAHSRARILHAGGDATGLQIEETLRRRALAEGIEVRERTVLRRLIARGGHSLVAILSDDRGRSLEEVGDRPVVLASGGAGSLYRLSSNPAVATGEGVAIAFRAGALVTDIEFIQFHPTAFAREGAPHYLITEALRGEGAVLRNDAGERFLARYPHASELAPRDIVTRAIQAELERTSAPSVFLDATAIPRDRLLARFPTICRFLTAYGLDLSRDLIPVAPAAHYMIGGVATDLEGRTSLAGLLACGEVASTGVHGANRLASNSLSEGLVFGERVVRQLLHGTPGGPAAPGAMVRLSAIAGRGADEGGAVLDEVRRVLWDSVGIVRTGTGLRDAERTLRSLLERCEPSGDEAPGVAANAAMTARLIARAALTREESRGAHYRKDFPRPRAEWRKVLGLMVRAG
ncbi:MAG: L-aspartate oxidase [Thermoplasmata archaeon]|nr:L-aspartate oxidase [Thermoplasmata archaeon]